MKRWPLGFLLVLALSAHAESFWDGNAAVQRGDAAFEAGMFAVSNAFARDTDIVIEDLATGKTTTARVTGRIDDRLDILVLLSSAAALPLGLEPGDIAHVRVTIKRVAAESAPILSEDTAPSADPDRVPPAVQREATVLEAGEETVTTEAGETAAVAEAVKSAAAAETTTVVETVKTPETAEAVAAAPATTPEAATVAPAGVTAAGAEVAEAPPEQPVAAETPTEAVEAEAAAAAGEPGTSAEDAAFLAGLAARSPQKQLFLPPREDEMFAYQEPVEPPAFEAAAAVEVVAQPAETAPATVEIAAAAAPEIASTTGPAEPGEISEPIALAEAEPPAEIRPELVETLAATAPEAEAEPEGAFAEPQTGQPMTAATVAAPVAKPAEAAPVTAAAPIAAAPAAAAPAAKPAEAAPATAAVKPEAVQTVLDLPGKGTFTLYLQLAAYANEALARDTAARLSSTYPVLVLAPQAGAKALYRVFIGPLNRAESGTLLNYFRYRGFPDAFVRTAQK